MLGWTFINLVTLERTDPFASGNGGHLDFRRVMYVIPIVFLYSTINVQRQAHDLDGYCTATDRIKANFVDLSAMQNSIEKSETIFLNSEVADEIHTDMLVEGAAAAFLTTKQVVTSTIKQQHHSKSSIVFLNEA